MDDGSEPAVVDPVDLLIADIKYTYGEDFLSEDQEEFWRAILHRLAADVINAVLPDDPIAQQAVIRKAEAAGLDLSSDDRGPRSGENVIDLAKRLRRP